MKAIARITLSGIFLALQAAAADPVGAGPGVQVFHHENVLGTSLELKVGVASLAAAEQAEAAALAEIARLAKILSSYDSASEFSVWCRTEGKPVRISPELFEVLGIFDDWRLRSGGALDAAAEAACRLWKNSAAQQRVPDAEDIATTVASIRRPHWRLDPSSRTATHLDDVPLVLNSFTKSYIVSRAADAVLAVPNVWAVVVNIGGDMVVRGELAEPVDITNPKADAENESAISRLMIRDRAVATSGNYRRGVEIAGRRYSHIVDPRTGQPAGHVLSATVVAPHATDAGALATAFNVLTPAESLRLAASVPGVECLLITKDGGHISSKGWNRLEAPRIQFAALGGMTGLPAAVAVPAPLAEAPAGQAWDDNFELVVSFELSRIEGQRAKRPYVAVWVEDKEKFPVRTLALWLAKPKWLPDLKSWSHSEKLRALTEGDDLSASVSSATRSPGKYTLKWDGRDDKGQPVRPGRYTVFIEAAREHGTHQVMKQELDFAGSARQVQLKGNVEIAAAALDYRRKVNGR